MTSRIASSRGPSSEKTSPMRFFTSSRDNTLGGTAVALPAIVATAAAFLFFVLDWGSCPLARPSSTSTDFGVRMDDNVAPLTPAPVGYDRNEKYPVSGF